MKYLCPSCERMVELESFRMDGSALVVTCGRCGQAARAQPSGLGAATGTAAATVPGGGQAFSVTPPFAGPFSTAVPARAEEPNKVDLRVVTLRGPAAVRAAAEAARSAYPLSPPDGHCPKCIGRITEGSRACRFCGLSFAAYDAAAHAPSPFLVERWTTLLAAWDRTELHDQVLAQAVTSGELAAVGRLYRIRLAHLPEDPYAQRGRDEVLRLASLPASTSAVGRPPTGAALASDDGSMIRSRALKWIALAVVMVLAIGMLASAISRLTAPVTP